MTQVRPQKWRVQGMIEVVILAESAEAAKKVAREQCGIDVRDEPKPITVVDEVHIVPVTFRQTTCDVECLPNPHDDTEKEDPSQ